MKVQHETTSELKEILKKNELFILQAKDQEHWTVTARIRANEEIKEELKRRGNTNNHRKT